MAAEQELKALQQQACEQALREAAQWQQRSSAFPASTSTGPLPATLADCIQAFVFFMLTMFYIKGALEAPEH